MTSVSAVPSALAGQRLASVAIYGSVPVAIVAVVWMRSEGWIAPTPTWIVALTILGAAVANLGTTLWVKGDPTSAVRIHARIAASVIATAAVIYSIGWGALLVVSYALGSAELLRTIGPKVLRANIGWNCLLIAAGETAVALGLAPSVIDPHLGHAVAITGAFCLAIVTDVLGTAARAAEAAEEETRERGAYFEALIQHATDIIGDITPDGVVRSVSPAVSAVLGYTPAEVEGREVATFFHPDDRPLVQPTIDGIVAAPGEAVSIEVRLMHRDGTPRVARATLTCPGDGRPETVVMNLHDLTLQRHLEEQLRYDARHDALTGILNRKAFARASERACRTAGDRSGSVSMLYIDLDGFKQINDSFGHETGDRVLVVTAERLAACIRPQDVLARLGGDEFAVMLDDVSDRRLATDVADRILDCLSQPIAGLPHDVRVGASIGIAVRSKDGIEISGMLREADEAMYQAKRKGRARWELTS